MGLLLTFGFIFLFQVLGLPGIAWLQLDHSKSLSPSAHGILSPVSLPLCFYERPTSVPVFVNQKKSKEDFAFMEKGKMQKLCCTFVLPWAIREAAVPQAERVDLPIYFPGSHTQHLSIQLLELWTGLWESVLYLDLFCASFPKKCSELSEKLTRGYFWVCECSKNFPYKLMAIASSLYIISAYKRFQRNTLLSDSRGNL